MHKSFGVLLLVGVFLLSFVPKASADLILAGDAGAASFCATDNNSICTYGTQLFDADPTVGTLSLPLTLIGGLSIVGSVQTATIGPPYNVLESSSISITNLTGAPVTLTASISATNFVGPVSEAFTTGSGTWGVGSQGSSTTYTWWNDPTNQQGGESSLDRPGLLVDSFSDTANTTVDSFSHNGGPFAVNDPSLFSMTLGFDLNLLAFDSLISRGQSEVKEVAAVPDGGTTMSFLGLTLLGVAAVRRKFLV